MGLHGCSASGELDSNDFSEPLPWIGLYMAGASLVCLLAMAMDAYHGFRRRKLWFPCKFFSLNAASLTLLAIATKLPVDLSTSMPQGEEQLTKLSGTILICTAMGNFMTSLGTMQDSEMLSNVVALAILVITVVVNIGIQMGTGAIYAFLPEHVIIMVFMIVLLMILVSSALTVPTAKQLLEHQYKKKHKQQQLEQQYDKKHKVAFNEEVDKAELFCVDKLKETVNKYWMMAHSSSPQYVLGRSDTCIASGVFCLLSALILFEASVRWLTSSSSDFCSGESDYKWSIKFVFISQVITVVVGNIAPAIRWYNAIRFRSPESRKGSPESPKGSWFKVEQYWVQRLVKWKKSPLPFRISSRRCRKIAHVSKHGILDACIGIQAAVVLVCKFVSLASILPLSWISRLFPCCCKRQRTLESNRWESEEPQGFVLHLEGEDDLVHLIMESGQKDTEKWIDRGRNNDPTDLINLLKSNLSEGFNGVAEFDSNQIPPIGEKPPNCWALPVVTLTSIAVALPYIEENTIRSLRQAVNEGLRYVRLIEATLDTNESSRMREAADIVWRRTDIYDQWLDEDLHKLVTEEKHPAKIIRKLSEIAKESIRKFTDGSVRDTGPSEWPVEILACSSMYRIGETILKEYENKLGTVDEWFQSLRKIIADILGACLTNLPRVISMECSCGVIEVREESVRDAAYLLGEAETILVILGEHTFPNLDPDQMANIDEWRKPPSLLSSADNV